MFVIKLLITIAITLHPFIANSEGLIAGQYNTFYIKDNLLFMTDNNHPDSNEESNWRILTYDVKSASLDDKHAIALSNYNEAFIAGENTHGQLGINIPYLNTFVKIENMLSINKVKAINNISFLIDENNELWATGWNYHGLIDKEKNEKITGFVNIKSNVKSVTGSVMYIAVITKENELWVKGIEEFGFNRDWKKIDENVTKISGGRNHLLYLTEEDTVFGIGSTMQNQLGIRFTEEKRLTEKFVDKPIRLFEDAKSIATGNYHSLVLFNNNSVFGVGNNGNGQLGLGHTGSQRKWIKLADNIKEVHAGGQYSVLKNNEELYGFSGNNAQGQLGFKQERNSSSFYGSEINTNQRSWLWKELSF